MNREQLLAGIAALERCLAHAEKRVDDATLCVAMGWPRERQVKAMEEASQEAESLSRILPILRTLAELSDEQRAYLRDVNIVDVYQVDGVFLDVATAHRIAAKLFSGEP